MVKNDKAELEGIEGESYLKHWVETHIIHKLHFECSLGLTIRDFW